MGRLADELVSGNRKMRTYYLSFVDKDRPVGQRFLGGCVVDVDRPAKNGHDKWAVAAVQKSWELECNPGGEVMILNVTGSPHNHHFPRGILLSRAEMEAIDAIAEDLEAPEGL